MMFIKINGVVEFSDDFNEPITKSIKKSLGDINTIIVSSNYSHISKCKISEDSIQIVIKDKYIIKYDHEGDDITAKFYENFNEELTSGDICNLNYCTSIIVHKNYDKSLDQIEGYVETIIIKNSHIIHLQDKNLIEISENISLDNKLYNIISKYTKVIFSNDFNNSIDNLHNGLEELEITSLRFNYPLDNLPNTIKKIVLRLSDFNQGLDKLPESLIDLDINFWLGHDCSLDNLPSGLKYFKIDSLRCRPNCLINNLPSNLYELNVNNGFCRSINILPPNLKKFIISYEAYNEDGEANEYNIPNLNNGLEYLEIRGLYYKPLNNLPSTLKTLIVNPIYDILLTELPNSLEKVYSYKNIGTNIKSLYPNVEFIKLE